MSHFLGKVERSSAAPLRYWTTVKIEPSEAVFVRSHGQKRKCCKLNNFTELHWTEVEQGHYVSCHITLTSPLLRGEGVQNMKLTKQIHLATSIKTTSKCPDRLVLCIHLSTLFTEVHVHTSSIHHCEIKGHMYHYLSPPLYCWCFMFYVLVRLTIEVWSYRSCYKISFNSMPLSTKSHQNEADAVRHWKCRTYGHTHNTQSSRQQWICWCNKQHLLRGPATHITES
jgi:hypothetical protein